MADISTTLSDAEAVPEAPTSPTHVTIRREDYRPPDWLVPEIRLEFELDLHRTRVRATIAVERNGDHQRPLKLDGDGLVPLSVRVDGEDGGWRMDGPQLVIDLAGRPGNDRNRGRDRPDREHQADGPVRVERDAMHPVRGGGLPAHYLLPRPSRRAVEISRADGGGHRGLPDPAVERQSRRDRRGATAGIGRSGRTRSPSRAICSRWSPATSRPTGTASPPCRAAKSSSTSGCAKRTCPRRPRDGEPQAGDGLGRAGLRPRI